MDALNSINGRHCADSHKVFFMKDYIARSEMQVFTLRNPGNGRSSKYIFHKKSNQFLELLKFSEPNRTWFIGEIVGDDGGIYLSTPIDPLFLLLHYIQDQASDKYVPIEHVLVDEAYGDLTTIANVISIEQLLLISDQKGDPELKAIKYNKDKTLSWLAYKCKQLQDALCVRKLNLDSGAKSSTFVVSTKLNDQQAGDIQLLAFGILSDYLSVKMSDNLSEHLNLEVIKSRKRKQNSNDAINRNNKKIKFSIKNEDEVITPTTLLPEKKTSAKAKQLAKSAKGSKNIMSFFKAK